MSVTTPPITLQTERLLLRPLRDSDLDAFAAMHADPLVVAHLHQPLTRTESEMVLDRIRTNTARDGVGPFAVEVQGGAVDQPPAQRAERVQAAHHEPGGGELEDEVHAPTCRRP